MFDDEIHIDEKKGVKNRANELEKRLAKRFSKLGGQRQPASGALWGAKGDLKIGKFALGDNKSTKNRSVRLKSKMWEKIKKETLDSGKDIPFLELQMKDTEPFSKKDLASMTSKRVN